MVKSSITSTDVNSYPHRHGSKMVETDFFKILCTLKLSISFIKRSHLLLILRTENLPFLVICSTLVRCYWCISILIIIPTVRCCSLIGPLCVDRLLCFLIVGIQASGISIPLSLLMLLGLSLKWIASLTLRVYQCVPVSG